MEDTYSLLNFENDVVRLYTISNKNKYLAVKDYMDFLIEIEKKVDVCEFTLLDMAIGIIFGFSINKIFFDGFVASYLHLLEDLFIREVDIVSKYFILTKK